MNRTIAGFLCVALLLLCACVAPADAHTGQTAAASPTATPKPTTTPEPTEAPETLEQLQADLATASPPLSAACRYADGYYYYAMLVKRGAMFESVLIRFSESLESEVLYRGDPLNMEYTVLNGIVYFRGGDCGIGVMRITSDGEVASISKINPLEDHWYYVTERYQYVLEAHNAFWGQILRVPNDPAYADVDGFNTGDEDTARCLRLTGDDEKVHGFVPYEGYLYYSCTPEGEEEMSLWRVLPDGSGKERVCDGLCAGALCLDDDGRLYCASTKTARTTVANSLYANTVHAAPGRQYLEPDGTLTTADYTAVYPIGADADYRYYDGGLMQVRAKADGQLTATKHENAKGYRISKATGATGLTYGVNLYWYAPVGDYLINETDALMIPKAGGEPVALPGSEEIRLEIERYARVPSVLIDGEGSVKLELSGSSEYAVYYLLYRSDDVTPGHEVRAVYLNHVSDGEMYFPPGNYVLKIARGGYWISDAEGFGESGVYSRSVPTEMTAGVYSIGESVTSGFGSDAWGGLG